MTGVESELIVEAVAYEHIEVKRIRVLVVVLAELSESFGICLAKVPLGNTAVDMVEYCFYRKILKSLQYIYYMVVDVVGYLYFGFGVYQHIATTAEHIDKCVDVLWKNILQTSYHAMLVADIVERRFVNHVLILFE